MLKLKILTYIKTMASVFLVAMVFGIVRYSNTSAVSSKATVSDIATNTVRITLTNRENNAPIVSGFLYRSSSETDIFSATLVASPQNTRCQSYAEYSISTAKVTLSDITAECRHILQSGVVETVVNAGVLQGFSNIFGQTYNPTGLGATPEAPEGPDLSHSFGPTNIPSDVGSTATAPCNAGMGLSWLFCSLMDVTTVLTKWGRDILTSMLEFNPKFIEYDGVIYKYWAQFRNIANLALLFGFMAVIFSQATSIGLSAYGVKKLLPRIVLFAIIVNLSFFVCQILIDTSNIVGTNLQTALSTISKNAGAATTEDGNPITGDTVWEEAKKLTAIEPKDGIWENAIGMFSMSAIGIIILPLMLIACLAVIIALAVMIVRIIVIIAMVIISPVAIASAILPGTKGFFNFWKGTFTSMLVMFPIIGLIFGAADMTASLLLSEQFKTLPIAADPALQGGLKVVFAVILYTAAFIAIPFTPGMGKKAKGAITGAIKKVGDGSKKVVGATVGQPVKNQVTKTRTAMLNSQHRGVRALAGAGFIARKQGREFNETELKRAKAGAAAKHISNNSRYTKEQQAQAAETTDKLETERAARTFAYNLGGDVQKALEQAVKNGDYHLANVALETAASKGDAKAVDDGLEAMSKARKIDGSAAFDDGQLKKASSNLLDKSGDKISSNNLGLGEKLKQIAQGKDARVLTQTKSDDLSILSTAISKMSNADLAKHKQFGDFVQNPSLVDGKRTVEIYNNDVTYQSVANKDKPHLEYAAIKAGANKRKP